MNNLQMLKRKFILRNWISPKAAKDKVNWYKGLLSERTVFNPKRLP